MKRVAILIFVCLAANARAARFLFDADHGESAGNADWVIDADLHNLTWNSSGTFTVNTGGSESNAQRIPTPAASGITAGTAETYWDGAISAWAVDLVKRGHSVETLPAGTTFTYSTSNTQDLTNYDVVIIDEPNVLFTNSEKQALLSFVSNGGSLFMISDHVVSDRNGDGQDSVSIWNDFLTNNGLTNNPFGIIFRTSGTGSNESGNNTFNHNIVGDPILNGPVGVATNMAYFNGNEFQIDTTKNPTVISRMWFGLSSDSNNFCGLASLQYGKGRVVVLGDSSTVDDGTGDPNDTSLFDGYTTDAGGVQHIWILNASEWLAAPLAVVASPTNTWTNSVSGKWEVSANWLNGTPSLANAADLITNATTKTVTIDAVTTNTPSSLTISNLTVSGPSGTINTLQLTNAGVAAPLTILNAATIDSGGALMVSNSAMFVGSSFSAQGTLTVQNGGTIAANGSLTLGSSAGATGTLWMTGGRLVVTNNAGTARIFIGDAGSGAMILSNGTVQMDQMFTGNAVGGSGTITIAGGTNLSPSTFVLGQSTFSTGTVWVTSGVLGLTNSFRTAFIEIAGNGVGQMTVSNGLMLADRALVASLSTMGRGTLTVVGGTTIINTNMVLGSGCGSLGNLVVAGGNVFVTNATATAVLEVRGGMLELDSGTLVIDKLVMTNACGQFVRTGGTLIYGSAVLDPNRDNDGDGIPNGYEQSHGLDPLNAVDANLDNDGDGMSNLQEYLAGTDPTNGASYFHISNVVSTGNDVSVTWMMGPGKTNALQWTTGTGDGSYQTNSFADLFIVTNTIGSVTNYLDAGAATNIPSRFYRVRLVP